MSVHPMILLTTVENSFEVQGRGCYITPRQWESDLRIRKMDKIQLKTPDGNTLSTCVNSIELGTAISGTFMAIGLPHPIAKQDVPEGTEIWLVEQHAS
jgi:hypothetical protein